MSKRLNNTVDPFLMLRNMERSLALVYAHERTTLGQLVDESGVDETRRKFFGTLYNTYSFFALYANVDGFTPARLCC